MQEEFVLDLDGLFFEDLLAQAVEAPENEAAQQALQGYVQEVLQSGDLERTMALSMVLGATACLHSHLESTANSFASVLGDQKYYEDTPHEHDHDDLHDHSDETPSRSSKSPKASTKKQTPSPQSLRFTDVILKYFRKRSPTATHARTA